MREDLNGRALGFLKSSSKITIIEIKEDGQRGKVVTSDIFTEKFVKMEIGGQEGNTLIALDEREKEILLCIIRDNFKIEVIEWESLFSPLNDKDDTWEMTITPDAKYIFVHSFNSRIEKGAKYLLSINGLVIKLCAKIESNSDSEDSKCYYYSMAFLKNVGDEIVFKCIPWEESSSSTTVTFTYNKKTEEFKELKPDRTIVNSSGFIKLTRQGTTLYGIGNENCRLLTLT